MLRKFVTDFSIGNGACAAYDVGSSPLCSALLDWGRDGSQ